ncbi:lysosomal acid lipase/cholesteryl ester hydrolase [Capronia coronata CBS 617.96]|uniref:Lysosomal acid lipase/cholesteryl ester hydrolase n=1 Tax=Capronia coronata CBS 617.96 TaxID=1182541 RepID=W9Y2N5_9EURO|nr:lysosomal acid lipase/cholesteryl ester hydrolase [Capronia coronata CBS 617.96]EXJ83875.1 lysosomal acid lipase/cholesteryl ester hydrolase [Capronia coronata CBS 617.96]
MARVPLIGRLFWQEYLALLGSLILVALEVLVRCITLGLPQPIIRFCYKTSKNLFNSLSSAKSKQARSEQKFTYSTIATCSDFTELCALFGYYAEEHIVQTGDGYLLGVHRLPFRKGEEETGTRVNAGPDSIKKPVVYLHHGLLMNSEVWVCLTEEERCLPFTLVSQGYDVWLGNNRGNKYSKKSTRASPTSSEFWNFSIDEFAFHDVPNTIDYILNATSQTSLSYIGFSQGTAQAFAALSIHPGLNDKVNLFVALAPAMSPAGLSNGIVDSLIKTSPDVLFLAFGRKSILSSATMWQSILYPPIFVRLIDMSLAFLFAWYGRNISVQQKLAAYPHLYSFTSTKSVVHWFQIIRNRSFQMYDDDSASKFSVGARRRYYKVAKFPTRNIRTPIVLVYGGSDSLVDIRVMLKELPRHTIATEIPQYEHLDFLWAKDVHTHVFPHVLDALRYYALGRTSNGIPKSLALSIADTAHLYKRQNKSLSTSTSTSPSTWSEEEETSYSDYDGANDTPKTPRSKSFAQQLRERQYQNQHHPQQASRRRSASSPTTSSFMTWVEQYYKKQSRPSQGAQAPGPAVDPAGSKKGGEEEQEQSRIDKNARSHGISSKNKPPGLGSPASPSPSPSSSPSAHRPATPPPSSTPNNKHKSSDAVAVAVGADATPTAATAANGRAPNLQSPLQLHHRDHQRDRARTTEGNKPRRRSRSRETTNNSDDESSDGRRAPGSFISGSGSGRSSPNPIRQHAFTSKGIRIGSSKPSVGTAMS